MNPKDVIVNAIRDSWCKETSCDPDNWNERNPAYGQSVVSSMVYQYFFDGAIYECTAILSDGKTESHYLNALFDPSEQEFLIDLTAEQFPAGTKFVDYEYASLGYLYSNKNTLNRFWILVRNVLNKIGLRTILIYEGNEGQLIGLLNMIDVPVYSVNFLQDRIEIKILNSNSNLEKEILATGDNITIQ